MCLSETKRLLFINRDIRPLMPFLFAARWLWVAAKILDVSPGIWTPLVPLFGVRSILVTFCPWHISSFAQYLRWSCSCKTLHCPVIKARYSSMVYHHSLWQNHWVMASFFHHCGTGFPMVYQLVFPPGVINTRVVSAAFRRRRRSRRLVTITIIVAAASERQFSPWQKMFLHFLRFGDLSSPEDDFFCLIHKYSDFMILWLSDSLA